MATLLYGGAFNPITIAHLICAQEAMEDGGFHEVIFIPCGDGWYKKSDLISFEHRLEMIKLATRGHAKFHFSQIEGDWAKQGKKTYTLDVYRYMQQFIGGHDVWWLTGSDNLAKISLWHNFPAIKQEMKFAIMPRPNFSIQDEMILLDTHSKIVRSPLLDISSTNIRNRIKQGKCIDYFVHDSVCKYIHENNLYLNKEGEAL